MSFVAKLGALTEELVTLITATSPEADPERFNIYRESSLRNLRHHNYLRTNQYDVENQLVGLDERFRVNNREGLADALRQRLDDLSPRATKWSPDILHFLLELSDQPTQKARLSELDALREPEANRGPKLTWEDIAREDGWDGDRALWKSIDYADSSDEEGHNDARSNASTTSGDTATSGTESNYRRTVQAISIEARASSHLQQVKETQGWRARAQPKDATGKLVKIRVSEFHVIREVLYMLRGLPTTLFGAGGTPSLGYQLSDVSWDTYRALIMSFAECGRRLLPLRTFVRREQDIALLRAFQDAIGRGLGSFDQTLVAIESRFIPGREDVTVSLISVLEEVKIQAGPLHALADIVQQLEEERNSHAFRYLELLFDAAAAAHLGGNEPAYGLFGTIFLNAFRCTSALSGCGWRRGA